MTTTSTTTTTNGGLRRGDYGFDAPYVPLAFGACAALAGGLGAWSLARGATGSGAFLLANTAWFGFAAASYLYTTRVGKFRVWAELLDELALRGDERVLDVGCGRGAVLLLAAERVPRGRATGLDLWSRADQSGNAEVVTRRNAALEGVADRVALETGDMRKLPFADGAFDLVVSSLAVHNIPDAEGRAAAVDELYRVLGPGGRLLLADFRYADAYARRLEGRGAVNVARRRLGWRFWYGGPYAGTTLVSARKPA